ncbi:conserved hypothetical protein [Histoplasma capsulatum H143]|uniref:Uncharacterized protein n=1 Tax=Ajellomyces capsulatus (strain H143) TaxID=544712 RepID=C6HC61_AJECH|nr:conserved hypothetical protein [Histoplasma capsulatum H143]
MARRKCWWRFNLEGRNQRNEQEKLKVHTLGKKIPELKQAGDVSVDKAISGEESLGGGVTVSTAAVKDIQKPKQDQSNALPKELLLQPTPCDDGGHLKVVVSVASISGVALTAQPPQALLPAHVTPSNPGSSTLARP